MTHSAEERSESTISQDEPQPVSCLGRMVETFCGNRHLNPFGTVASIVILTSSYLGLFTDIHYSILISRKAFVTHTYLVNTGSKIMLSGEICQTSTLPEMLPFLVRFGIQTVRNPI